MVYALFNHHKAKYGASGERFAPGLPGQLHTTQRETVDAVLNSYGDMTAAKLRELTYAEQPWTAARGATGTGENGTEASPTSPMKSYYTALSESAEAVHAVEYIKFPIWAR